ncbi:MAG: 23S rRNA (pseudouridine(1915)-N(3))-methyltransferase RlmH [Epsilonproteobacteria bacterium]|nr:23S rRNA (pseudouridine(1915)-N(3))-methyltransferase RlmH [Campylobacterota bacterium]
MEIRVYSIEKKEEYQKIIDEFIKQSKQFANVQNITIFNKTIAKSNTPKTYSEVFERYLNGFNIALSPEGKLLDSMQFAKLINNKSNINFFIGGAWGLEDSFKQRCDTTISLTPLTLSHKIAKLVLFEQIFRGLAINHNHPYHK